MAHWTNQWTFGPNHMNFSFEDFPSSRPTTENDAHILPPAPEYTSFQQDGSTQWWPLAAAAVSQKSEMPVMLETKDSPSVGAIKKEKVGSEAVRAASRKRRTCNEEARYHCTIEACGGEFTTAHNLRIHVDSHRGIKRHRCHCGKGFGTSGDLKRHRDRRTCYRS
ncbi:hypothetical protein BDP27DRAFT_1442740 [Rhodocollybia butyracea]|uniref:C2H2-type domain-containing protein n=1 Tax=Rhodocollybia butyracea TaxID=206335 RepID=A0A9P5Q963_9AGAR|nr:hypothetical protein BDP27DRAFT_1442740 [Rhodocollybia butyracea]